MAERGRKPCYVYRLFVGHETVYVGKGSGRRLADQRARFRADGEIIEADLTDEQAFQRERHWISTYQPTFNRSPGGNGGRCRPKRRPRRSRDEIEIDRIGSRRYAARFLLTRLDERNCERYGVSKVGLDRLRQVANGPRC